VHYTVHYQQPRKKNAFEPTRSAGWLAGWLWIVRRRRLEMEQRLQEIKICEPRDECKGLSMVGNTDVFTACQERDRQPLEPWVAPWQAVRTYASALCAGHDAALPWHCRCAPAASSQEAEGAINGQRVAQQCTGLRLSAC
jgi:hypothetical protein